MDGSNLARGIGHKRRTIQQRLRQSMVSGLAITVPVLVTLLVFRFAVGFLLDSVTPISSLIQEVSVRTSLEADAVAVGFLATVIFVVGFVAESDAASGRFEKAFDDAMSSIPGLGSVYSSFNEMSQLLLDSDTASFQEVKLVEYPTEGSYTVAFVVADTPSSIRTATETSEMATVYMPLAPNPVMGGFVMHVNRNRLHDVDMTVEEGIQSIVTSGIAVGDPDSDSDPDLREGDLDPPRHVDDNT